MNIKSINKSLRELLKIVSGRTDTEVDQLLEDRIADKIQNGYDWHKSIKCKKCGHLFKPFYFGDKSYNRKVMQDCPECGTYNTFSPISVQGNPKNFILGQ